MIKEDTISEPKTEHDQPAQVIQLLRYDDPTTWDLPWCGHLPSPASLFVTNALQEVKCDAME